MVFCSSIIVAKYKRVCQLKSILYDNPSRPLELKFNWKDALPKPEYARIKRGDKNHFQFMKANIEPLLELAKALIPSLIEFTILVTVPGWVVERPGGEW